MRRESAFPQRWPILGLVSPATINIVLGAELRFGCMLPVPASRAQDVGHEGAFARPELHQAELFRAAPLLPAGDAPDSDHLAERLPRSSKVGGLAQS